MSKKHIAKKALKFTGKALKIAAGLSLDVLTKSLEESEKEHEPTLYERTTGEKMYFSDKYYIPNKE